MTVRSVQTVQAARDTSHLDSTICDAIAEALFRSQRRDGSSAEQYRQLPVNAASHGPSGNSIPRFRRATLRERVVSQADGSAVARLTSQTGHPERKPDIHHPSGDGRRRSSRLGIDLLSRGIRKNSDSSTSPWVVSEFLRIRLPLR